MYTPSTSLSVLYYSTDLPGDKICNVESVMLPYPLITLQHRIILQNENKQLLPATEPSHA